MLSSEKLRAHTNFPRIFYDFFDRSAPCKSLKPPVSVRQPSGSSPGSRVSPLAIGRAHMPKALALRAARRGVVPHLWRHYTQAAGSESPAEASAACTFPMSAHTAPSLPTPQLVCNVQITPKTTLEKLYTWPAGTVLEYPETSATGSIGHLFPISTFTPTRNMIYSTGDPKGGPGKKRPVFVDILLDDNGQKVPCKLSFKTCSSYSTSSMFVSYFSFRPRHQGVPVCRPGRSSRASYDCISGGNCAPTCTRAKAAG